jgi:hypothetical protein
MNKPTIKVGTVIQHKHSHKIAKITDVYHPPDNPYVISLSYKYVDTDNVRSIIDTELESFTEKWEVLDTKVKTGPAIPV